MLYGDGRASYRRIKQLPLCLQLWGIPASDVSWITTNFIADRASLSSKPIILEVSGMLQHLLGEIVSNIVAPL